MTTLTDVVAELATMAGVNGAAETTTGGNCAAVTVAVDGVPVLFTIGDGYTDGENGDDVTIGADWAEHTDNAYVETTLGTATETARAIVAFARSLVWTDPADSAQLRRVRVYGSDEIRDAAADWDDVNVITRHYCSKCDGETYRTENGYRTVSDESRLCPLGGMHNGDDVTYWQSVDSI